MSHAKRSYSQVNKKILSEQEFVKLSQTSYPNVKFDSDGTQNDILLKQFLDDLQSAAAAANVIVGITTAKTGHSERATSGAVSRHTKGAAVDITKFNGIDSGKATGPTDGNREFKKLGDKFVAELGKLGYNRVQGEYPSIKKSILWQTSKGGNHYNHVHVSNTTKLSNVGQPDLENKTESSNTGMNQVQLTLLWGEIYFYNKSIGSLKDFLGKMDTKEKRQSFYTKFHDRLLNSNAKIDLGSSLEEFEKKYGPSESSNSGSSTTDLTGGVQNLLSGAGGAASGLMDLFGGAGSFLGKLGSQAGDWLKALDISDLASKNIVAKKGDKNEEVRNIQRYLKSQGYNDIVPDGDFGNATEKAIKDFQQKNKLDPSGIVNLPTYDMLTRGGKVTIKYINPNDF